MLRPQHLIALIFLLGWCRAVGAALPIDLEVGMQSGVSLTAPQQWAKLLGEMDLARVRLRGAQPGDQPHVESTQQASGNRYRVLALLNSRDELVLPDRRFRQSDRKALANYFQQLPAQLAAEELGRFELTERQFREVFATLAAPLGFSTADKTVGEVTARIERDLGLPLDWQSGTERGSKVPLQAELQQLSRGTALTVTLRAAGMTFRPQPLADQSLHLVVERYQRDREVWPVGWKSEASSRQFAPQMFKALTVQIEGYTLTQALTALQPRIEMPVVQDQWLLDQQQIVPAQVQVKLPRRKTFVKGALNSILSQARLSGELRVDEQDQPFLWITQFGKDSPRAAR